MAKRRKGLSLVVPDRKVTGRWRASVCVQLGSPHRFVARLNPVASASCDDPWRTQGIVPLHNLSMSITKIYLYLA